MQAHDHHFKNLFLDFPKSALEWLLPEALQQYGNLQKISFIRQEPRKRRFEDRGLVLDMPFLFTFDNGQILLWLVEFQEDKKTFSIYRLLRYTVALMEQYPDVLVIPTVLFTARRQWKKDVRREIECRFGNRLFFHFEYQLVRIIDYRAKDYYHTPNPLLRILLPKMIFSQKERKTVICNAYKGLFDLVDRRLFDKYVDFIDIYAEISEEEKDDLYRELSENEETVMLAQYIRNKGFEEGIQQGIEQGLEQRVHRGMATTLKRTLRKRFGTLPKWAEDRIDQATASQLDRWIDLMLSTPSVQDLLSD